MSVSRNPYLVDLGDSCNTEMFGALKSVFETSKHGASSANNARPRSVENGVLGVGKAGAHAVVQPLAWAKNGANKVYQARKDAKKKKKDAKKKTNSDHPNDTDRNHIMI